MNEAEGKLGEDESGKIYESREQSERFRKRKKTLRTICSIKTEMLQFILKAFPRHKTPS